MIVVDTSALMAIILDEPESEACIAALTSQSRVLISAGTIVEALVVSIRQGVEQEMTRVMLEFGLEAVAVTGESALRVGEAYRRWGKGVHPAGLNFGDCFAYEVARKHDCGLLYVGNDFARTDVQSVLRNPA